eukprot:10060622-Alexandrium_andersonii.AAC.1
MSYRELRVAQAPNLWRKARAEQRSVGNPGVPYRTFRTPFPRARCPEAKLIPLPDSKRVQSAAGPKALLRPVSYTHLRAHETSAHL